MRKNESLHSYHSNIQETQQASKPKISQTTRWLLLICISLSYLIGTISIDMPSSLQSFFLSNSEFSLTSLEYSMLFSLIGLVSFFFSIFSGIIIDINGDDNGLLIASVMLNIGQLLFTFALRWQNFPLMICTRVLLGIGAEMIPDQINVMAPVWFRAGDLNLAYGFAVSCSLVGLISAQLFLPALYNAYGSLYYCSFIVYLLTCVAMLLCVVVYYGENLLLQRDFDETPYIVIEKNFRSSFQEIWKNIKKMDSPFVSFVFSGAIFIAVFQIYLANDNEILASGWSIDPQVAGYYIIFSYVVNLVASPAIGIWVDKFKVFSFFVLISFGFFIVAFFIFAVISNLSVNFTFVPLFLIGIGNAIFRSSFYCGLANAVKKMHIHSTACGIITSTQYFLSAVFNSVYAALKDHTKNKDYQALSSFSVLLAMLVVGIILLLFSWAGGNEARGGEEEDEVMSSFEDFELNFKALDIMKLSPHKKSSVYGDLVKFSDYSISRRKISNLKKISFI